jgi:hypothetical protein
MSGLLQHQQSATPESHGDTTARTTVTTTVKTFNASNTLPSYSSRTRRDVVAYSTSAVYADRPVEYADQAAECVGRPVESPPIFAGLTRPASRASRDGSVSRDPPA